MCTEIMKRVTSRETELFIKNKMEAKDLLFPAFREIQTCVRAM
jgi:hypothetical protein